MAQKLLAYHEIKRSCVNFQRGNIRSQKGEEIVIVKGTGNRKFRVRKSLLDRLDERCKESQSTQKRVIHFSNSYAV